jgi:predicted DCC family thiol-disulfide oxidoreductase YuxK
MKRLYILYDSTCHFCRRCRTWLDQQPAFVPLVFIPLQSPEVACRFPGIEALHPEKEIVVISDAGDVWQGGSAWVMCLWALRDYREWAQRLAHPALLPLARRACELVSENRHRLSRWLFHPATTTEELRQKLDTLPATACASDGYCKAR